MPNIKSQDDHCGRATNISSSYNNKAVIAGHPQPVRSSVSSAPGHNNNNVQLTTWLQSLTGNIILQNFKNMLYSCHRN